MASYFSVVIAALVMAFIVSKLKLVEKIYMHTNEKSMAVRVLIFIVTVSIVFILSSTVGRAVLYASDNPVLSEIAEFAMLGAGMPFMLGSVFSNKDSEADQ